MYLVLRRCIGRVLSWLLLGHCRPFFKWTVHFRASCISLTKCSLKPKQGKLVQFCDKHSRAKVSKTRSTGCVWPANSVCAVPSASYFIATMEKGSIWMELLNFCGLPSISFLKMRTARSKLLQMWSAIWFKFETPALGQPSTTLRVSISKSQNFLDVPKRLDQFQPIWTVRCHAYKLTHV